MAVIRPLMTGGYSLCRASDENVGKKRCNHLLGNHFNIQSSKKFNAIDISEENSKTTQSELKDLKAGFKSISMSLSQEEKQNILSEIRLMFT